MVEYITAHPVLTATGLLGVVALAWLSLIGSKAYKQAMLELARERDEGAKRMMERRAANDALIERLNRSTLETRALTETVSKLPRQHRAGLDVDVAQATAARARMASNMPQDEALTAAERARLERLKVPAERAPAALALDLVLGQRLTPEQEHRIRVIIREEILRARAREMGAE